MIRRLKLRFLRRDLAEQPAATAALLVLLILSALLMSTGAIVSERLIGSVDRLFEQAKPPHVLQMHRGEIDRAALDAFAAAHPEIDAWLIEEMLGFEGSSLTWIPAEEGAPPRDLSESLIDHLFVSQNEEFDFLLDASGDIPRPEPGEVFLPVSIQERFGIAPGDSLRIGSGEEAVTLRVVGAVRDAQMASSFASASRFLVSPADVERLAAAGGEPEAIIEYRLQDADEAASFLRAYEADEALPKNGQAVTFQMIRMLNAISDGLVAAALVFASLLIIAIAFINLRFVIRGAMEDDVREIGALKAIGLSMADIRGLYLAKYRLITVLACLLGGGLAPLAAVLLTAGIRSSYGGAALGPASIIAPALALLLVYLLVMAICRGVLRRIGRIEVVRALVHGSTLDERTAARRSRRAARGLRSRRLDAAGPLPLGLRLTLLELRADAGRWVLLPLVFALAAVLITLPANLLSTLESPRFVTYMGAADRDLRSDLLFGEDLPREHRELVAAMEQDPRLTAVESFARVPVEVLAAEEPGRPRQWLSLPVEAGDYSDTSLVFSSGAAPATGEIALSAMTAEQHGLEVGDEITLRHGGAAPVEVRVSGIYQDVTSGGRTAKLQAPELLDQEAETSTGFIVYADVTPGADPIAIAAEYRGSHPAASTVPMEEFVEQTLSFATGALRGATLIALGAGLAVAALITALFLRLHLVRERERFGVLGALGFSPRELARGVRLASMLAIVPGIVLGVIASATLGQAALSGLFASLRLGITEFTLIPDPWLAWVLVPLALGAVGLGIALAVTRTIRREDRTAWLR